MVANVGGWIGDHMVDLILDEVVIESELVTVDDGESTSVTFTVSLEEVGVHEVEVEGLQGSFTVRAPVPWVWVAAAILVVAPAAFYAYKRRKA